MQRNRILIVAVVVTVFVVVGGVFIYRSVGGGGRDVSLDATVTGTTMSPSDPSVKQNDRVTMNVTCDKAEEIHLHEYDIKFACEPGKKITHTFTADKTGSFDMELEATSTPLGKFVVSP